MRNIDQDCDGIVRISKSQIILFMEKQCENEVWNMRGNIRKFLSLEMAYKRAYRHLLDAQYRFLIDREIIRTDSENGISYDTWAKWLRS